MTDAERNAALLTLLKQWWSPPAELIATLPKGNVQLKYLGHSDTSRALTECDPAWTWEPMGYDENNQPVLTLDENGRPVGLWAWITVCGVRRPAYGSVLPGKGEAVKELIGDAIRNGAMRFGVAGGLWSKADRPEDAEKPSKAPRKKPEGKDTTEVGKANYANLVSLYGEEAVKGALAHFGIAQFKELVGDKLDQVDDSLFARKKLMDDMGATQE